MSAEKFINEVKGRAEKATLGPWFQSMATIVGADSLYVADLVSEQMPDKRVGQINADGRFIAHARTDVDRLVAMVEAARDALRNCTDSEYCGQRGEFCDNHTALAELDRIAGSGNISEPPLIKTAGGHGVSNDV